MRPAASSGSVLDFVRIREFVNEKMMRGRQAYVNVIVCIHVCTVCMYVSTYYKVGICIRR